jgi:hypothetical protein
MSNTEYSIPIYNGGNKGMVAIIMVMVLISQVLTQSLAQSVPNDSGPSGFVATLTAILEDNSDLKDKGYAEKLIDQGLTSPALAAGVELSDVVSCGIPRMHAQIIMN